MPTQYEVRANFDRDSVVVYQAYNSRIANPALKHQRFVAPFSFGRMTWIKPSFLWLMHRSNWGRKRGQERTLQVRIKRSAWDEALSQGVLTSPDGPVFGDAQRWQDEFPTARVHVQWDTERSLRGAALDHYSIQVGLSRHVIRQFVDEWILAIDDLTPLVAKISKQLQSGNADKARRALPPERVYPVERESAHRLMVG